MKVFLLLIASHLCGDLLTYSRFLAKAKRTDRLFSKIGGLFVHCLVHALFVLVWLWFFPWGLKIWASTYVFVTHFLIDFSRVGLEPLLIDKRECVILKRKDVFLYFFGNRDAKTEEFMKKYFKQWALLNVGDQLLHVAAIGAFVAVVPV